MSCWNTRPQNQLIARHLPASCCYMRSLCNKLIPLHTCDAVLPSTFLDVKIKSLEKTYSEIDEYGLGLSTSIYLYADDATDNEGNDDECPAILFAIVLKVPFEIDETVPLDILNDQFQKMAIEQDIELDSELKWKTQTAQGYETEYVIYNGTTKTEKIGTDEINYKVTKGSESKYVGEVWKAPEYNLLVVSMGPTSFIGNC